MNKGKLIQKIALLIGYLMFAGFSAYFTASSLSLNLLNGTNLWLIYALVLVVAILAGWCLNVVIAELQKKVLASKAAFIFGLIGFFIFWSFSFLTNVHYFFVEKHGYSILTKELSSTKEYIVENTTKSNKNIEDQKNTAQMAISASVHANIASFEREINNTMEHHSGFGEACINILNATENLLTKDTEMYGDKNEYVVFDEVRDAGDRGVTQRSRFPELQTKYTARILQHLNTKLGVIGNFYDRKKDENVELTDLLATIEDLETVHLPAVLKDGSIDAFYKYYDQQEGKVVSKMPNDYSEKCVVKSGDEVISYNVYPAKRMFDTMSVWGDIVSGRLVGMTMIQWIIISLIFDIVAFILFALFRR